MAALEPEEHIRTPLLLAQWLKVAFVHWAFDPDDVQALLPEGLTVDEYDGAAWVTVTPLRMARVRPAGPLPIPGLDFAETNLRTYVRGPDGRDGLWFLSIEASSAAMTIGSRLAVGAPYNLGDLSLVDDGDRIFYAGSRRDRTTSYRLAVRPGAPIGEPSDRDVWLTGRWRAYTRHAGRLWQTPVEHEPWPLAEATADELHQTLTTAARLPPPGEPAVVHFSEGVRDVRLGVSRPVR